MTAPAPEPEPLVDLWQGDAVLIRVDRRGPIVGTGRAGRLGCRIPLLDRDLRARVAAAFACTCCRCWSEPA